MLHIMSVRFEFLFNISGSLQFINVVTFSFRLYLALYRLLFWAPREIGKVLISNNNGNKIHFLTK